MSNLKNYLVVATSAFVGAIIGVSAILLSSDLQNKILNSGFSSSESVHSNYRSPFFSFDHNFDEQFGLRSLLNFDIDNSWLPQNSLGFQSIQINEREDDHYFYLDIPVEDPDSTTINTRISNGYLTITGTTEKRRQSSSDLNSYFKSSFSRTLLLPAYVDVNKMKILSEEDKLVLRFPKFSG